MRRNNQLSLQLISKEIRRAEREYMNIHPPPPNNALITPLATTPLYQDSWNDDSTYCYFNGDSWLATTRKTNEM